MLTQGSECSKRSRVSTATRELQRGQVAKRAVEMMVAEIPSPHSSLGPCVAFAQQFVFSKPSLGGR